MGYSTKDCSLGGEYKGGVIWAEGWTGYSSMGNEGAKDVERQDESKTVFHDALAERDEIGIVGVEELFLACKHRFMGTAFIRMLSNFRRYYAGMIFGESLVMCPHNWAKG